MNRRAFSLILLCFCNFEADAEQPTKQQEIEDELRTLNQELVRYKEILEITKGKKSAIEEKLEINEKGISHFIREIENIGQALNKNNDKISRLSEKHKKLNSLKTKQQEYVEKQVLAAYELGTQEFTKLLLNQDDPNKLTRLLNYYDYFIKARAKQIVDYKKTLTELDQITEALIEERVVLKSNRQELDRKRLSLATSQHHKRETLAELSALALATGKKISVREGNREDLKKLLNHIRTKSGEFPKGTGAVSFKGMRGKMLLPVDGKVTEYFGERRNDGKLKWNGLFIEAEEGLPVYAVHYGKVVFSDWLRGFGLLIIISHGDGYMSLYGHNQVLYLETGEWVEAGDRIATVGDSGGQSQTGLYFEIRINGEPRDPAQWCVSRDHRPA